MELAKGQLFIGQDVSDAAAPVVIDASDLTTHAVIVGMTGSGKTGLGIGIVEEALLNGIPCLVIDPKGDMGNLLLQFPDFRPSDFRPWVDEAEANRLGVTPDELAADTANTWKEGLSRSGIEAERLRTLRDSTEMTIYTPGSSSGVPINVLGSLAAPDLDWEKDAETLRDEIKGFVSSLLVMAGVEADPVSSPEHILLSTIVETSWRKGEDLDLATLIGQIPKPPVRKLGVFELDVFFPEKDRMALAMKLNTLLASPSFASWLTGVPLDIGVMLEGGDRTKAAIVYLSHLSDSERQFVVTLLLSKLVTWFRGRAGTSDLRTLVYMDELFGFAPPTAEPPSKRPILTILKQARAHGVGMVLSTQNPVDLDYKAMSNAGTWMIGRLQTENDKRRVLEGLAGASGEVDVAAYDRLISDLDKRRFVLNSNREPQPAIFSTRWAMSYLAGPLTRDQVSALMEGSARSEEARGEVAVPPAPANEDVSVPAEVPPTAAGVATAFLDPAAQWAPSIGADPKSTSWEAAAAVTVGLLYDDTRTGVDHRETYEAVVYPLTPVLDGAQVTSVDHDPRDFLDTPPKGASFVEPEVPIGDASYWTGLEKDLTAYLAANRKMTVFANSDLGLYSRVGESREEFAERCRQAAEDRSDQELAKLRDAYGAKLDRARQTIAKSEIRVRELGEAAAAKQQEELISGAGDLLGTFLGGKRGSTALNQAARRRTASRKAQARAEAAATALDEDLAELQELEDELAAKITEVTERNAEAAAVVSEVEIPLEKTDIRVAEVRMVWVPRSG